MSASMVQKAVSFDLHMHESPALNRKSTRGKGHYLCEECDEEVMGSILKQALEKRSKLVKKRRGHRVGGGFEVISSEGFSF
eukprot:EC690643.1.p3 GENE.EC690643.1~~EC690643.1.p3  ORF type:complete len:81 (+),score=30.26 EC690643.1:235-477(+)